ncbi:hypothetical protein PIB30_044575 [Stylosanthes scabra]|uniref:Uncharacterized protein n=1 Tax=Stylosanthes scabra TaxID=79078 RepID=A0ABU6XHA3_9FABA|nr:hypothetical protein [Stylosanthes scabra]
MVCIGRKSGSITGITKGGFGKVFRSSAPALKKQKPSFRAETNDGGKQTRSGNERRRITFGVKIGQAMVQSNRPIPDWFNSFLTIFYIAVFMVNRTVAAFGSRSDRFNRSIWSNFQIYDFRYYTKSNYKQPYRAALGDGNYQWLVRRSVAKF